MTDPVTTDPEGIRRRSSDCVAIRQEPKGLRDDNGDTKATKYILLSGKLPPENLIHAPFDLAKEVIPAGPDNDYETCCVCRIANETVTDYKSFNTKNNSFRVYSCGHLVYQTKKKDVKKGYFESFTKGVAGEFNVFHKMSLQKSITEKEVRAKLRYFGKTRVSGTIIQQFIDDRDAVKFVNSLYNARTDIYIDNEKQ